VNGLPNVCRHSSSRNQDRVHATQSRWTKRKPLREVAGIDHLQRHICELFGYLERNEEMLVHYAAPARRGEPISTAFVEINEIVAKRMNKKQQMALEQDDCAALSRRSHRSAE
jgi:hypothetical protein